MKIINGTEKVVNKVEKFDGTGELEFCIEIYSCHAIKNLLTNS